MRNDESHFNVVAQWRAAYGVDADGAVLVRPDGYVAWHSRSGVANPEGSFRAAFDQLLGRVAAMA